MADAYLGEIRMFAGSYAPFGWALCDGQLISIATYSALYSLLGTTYGGDGITTFGLPDLRGRAPMHRSGSFPIGSKQGQETVTLTVDQMPQHSHAPQAYTQSGDATDPTNAVWAAPAASRYSSAAPTLAMHSTAIGTAGTTQAHNNMMPFLTTSFIICLEGGVYPTQS
jgi:microcystin-dependent protein